MGSHFQAVSTLYGFLTPSAAYAEGKKIVVFLTEAEGICRIISNSPPRSMGFFIVAVLLSTAGHPQHTLHYKDVA